jgi:hypothetical protein
MKEFDLRNKIDIKKIRQDKMELIFGTWKIVSEKSDAFRFLEFLGRDNREDNWRFKHRAFEKYKPSEGNNLSESVSLNILKGSKNGVRPLFAGKLLLSTNKENTDEILIKLALSINPTRFCVYQITEPRRNPFVAPPMIFTDQYINSFDGEFALDENDNTALTKVARRNLSEKLYPRMFLAYIGRIKDYIDQELLDFYGIEAMQTYFFDSYVSLHYIENYWDIECPDPRQEVIRLAEMFTGFSTTNSANYYRNIRVLRNKKSISLSCDIRNYETLKIYAKTSKKIRIETSHNFSKNTYLSKARKYSFKSFDDFMDLIRYAEETSLNLANAFIDNLYKWANYPKIIHGKPLTFVSVFYRVVGDIDLAERLLRELVLHGGLTRKQYKEIPEEVAKNLKRSELIIYLPRPHCRYVVVPTYAEAAQSLNLQPKTSAIS